MDSLSDVAVFVAVVDEGSFTKAAERLQLSRSVISKYVSRLESRLGARLLNRTTRRLSLTEAGQVFYQRSRRGLDDIAEAEAEVSRLQGTPRGVLRVNTPMSFGILHIAPWLPEFAELHPDLTVQMSMSDRKLDVIDEGFDVSVRISELPDSSLIARRLATCRHSIVASPSYLQRHGTPRTPADLAQHQTLTYSLQQSSQAWHFLAPDGETTSIPIQPRLQVDNSLALREALRGGMGISRTPTFLVGDDIQQGRLTPLLNGYTTLEVSIYLVYPERRHLSPKVRAFVDFMADKIQDPPYWENSGN